MLILFALGLAAPVQLSHQGRVLDANGEPLVGNLDLDVVLFGSAAGADVLHTEDVTAPLEDGYYAVVLGVGGDLDSSVLLNPGGVWIEVQSGGAAVGARQALLQVPSAVVATSVSGGPVETTGVTVTGAGNVVLGQAASGSVCTAAGGIVYDPNIQGVLVCNGSTYGPISVVRIVADGAGRRWSDGSAAASCEEYRRPTAGSRLYDGLTGDGEYYIDPLGQGEWLAYCDMTTDDGGWTIIHSLNGANGQQPLVSDVEVGGDPWTYGQYNTSRAKKMALSEISSETLFHRSDGRWIRANAPTFDGNLATPNSESSVSVTLTARNGATASAVMGYANFNNSAGGDFGVRTGAFDHHSGIYRKLQTSCAGHYLYSYSSAQSDGDAGYNVNTALGDWPVTDGCASAEGGALVFRTAMR